MSKEVAIDIETVPLQGLSEGILEIARQRVEKKRGQNKDLDRFCSLTLSSDRLSASRCGTAMRA